jgi:prepilin-type processing-associated H-X9-DG protein
MSNVRQIAMAGLMYAQETKLYVSFVPAIGATPARDRKELLYPYLRHGKDNTDNAGNQAWHCPSNDRPAEEASYGFNTYLNGVRLNKIRMWSETVALCDAGLADTPAAGPSLATHCWPPGRPATASSCRPNHLRHPKQMITIGFVDGHAERLPMKPPFYPGPVGSFTPNGIIDPAEPDYSDKLWDLK